MFNHALACLWPRKVALRGFLREIYMYTSISLSSLVSLLSSATSFFRNRFAGLREKSVWIIIITSQTFHIEIWVRYAEEACICSAAGNQSYLMWGKNRKTKFDESFVLHGSRAEKVNKQTKRGEDMVVWLTFYRLATYHGSPRRIPAQSWRDELLRCKAIFSIGDRVKYTKRIAWVGNSWLWLEENLSQVRNEDELKWYGAVKHLQQAL